MVRIPLLKKGKFRSSLNLSRRGNLSISGKYKVNRKLSLRGSISNRENTIGGSYRPNKRTKVSVSHNLTTKRTKAKVNLCSY